jgi:hypothetical protein
MKKARSGERAFSFSPQGYLYQPKFKVTRERVFLLHGGGAGGLAHGVIVPLVKVKFNGDRHIVLHGSGRRV